MGKIKGEGKEEKKKKKGGKEKRRGNRIDA
jgi:hypothetical protein